MREGIRSRRRDLGLCGLVLLESTVGISQRLKGVRAGL
jgi:hypothetical protein